MTATKQKRPKPSPEWPMFWHSSGYWAKTVKYVTYYFGRRGSVADGPDFDAEAMAEYTRHISSIKAGRGKIPETEERLSVSDLCELFLESREQLYKTGELAARTWRDYQRIANVVAAYFKERQVEHLTPADFALFRQHLAKGKSIVTLANLVRVSRVIFRYAKSGGHLEQIPEFGDGFNEPSRKHLRRDRNEQRREHGLKMFTAEQIRLILEHEETSLQIRAMVYLGINAAYGNKDCSQLLRSQITRRGGRHWLEVERVKTQVERRCPLWPETVAALAAVREVRPDPRLPADADRVFLTKTGLPWVRDVTSSNDEVAKSFGRLLEQIQTGTDDDGRPVYLKRRGLSFYALRHTVETIGDEVRDKNALNLILGHVDESMAAIYRERLADERLVDVVEYVRRWLFTRNCVSCNAEQFSTSPSWVCNVCQKQNEPGTNRTSEAAE